MNNYDECHANAAECTRMAGLSVHPADKITWTELADHWLYLSPEQGDGAVLTTKSDRPWRPTLLGT